MEGEAPRAQIQRHLAAIGLSEAEAARLEPLVAWLEENGAELLEPLAERVVRARESDRLKTLFLRLAIRELKGPFEDMRNRVAGMAGESDPWRIREELPEMVEAVFRLNRLVRDLVDTTDIETGHLRLEQEPVDLASLLSDRISKRLRRLRGYRFQPEMPAGTFVLRGDRERFKLLMDDLLDAAIHLSPGGGIILVRLAREGEEAVLSTRIPTATLPAGRLHAFLEWLDAGQGDAETLGGSGIVLYRAHRTAEMYGGRLELAAPPEGGAAFTVRIPYRGEESGADG